MALYALGQQLPNGATVVSDSVQTLSDGTTIEAMRDSAGNSQTITTPAAGSALANLQALQVKAQQAMTSNATFQAIASPTNAQSAAQVQALTKQCNGIIRLLLGLVDTTVGT